METLSKRLEDDCVAPSNDEKSDDAGSYDGMTREICVHSRNLVRTNSDEKLQPKHKVFFSHSGYQNDFVEQLSVDLKRTDRYPFYAKHTDSLPIGEAYPQLIFDAIQQIEVGVLVLSNEFFTKGKWPMVELVAMVKELKKPNPSIKIIPVFYRITRDEWLALKNGTSLISQWNEWASRDTRINVEEWKEALETLKTIVSLQMTNGEVDLRQRIVDVICDMVDSESKFNDSHVQGKSRLCEAIRQKIDQQEPYNGVRVLGLHGIGGIGKTTICKVMCNEMSKEFRGKVCHIELKNSSKATELELLREVLKRLTDTRHEILDKSNIDECHHHLKTCIVNQPVFLAIDNIERDIVKQVKTFLGTKWSEGSVVILTARALGHLMYLQQYITERDCMEVPELTKDDATSLFLNHVKSAYDIDDHARIEMDEHLVNRCVEKCCFSKGTANKDRHYIPLALEVLGEELACIGYDPQKWNAQLKKIDTFEKELSPSNPIFSILRTSYDSLNDDAKKLFMDVALFLPCVQYQSWHWGCFLKCNLLNWLLMLHKPSTAKTTLAQLQKKSLLEDLGDNWTKIGMHDLWREFCVAEAKVKDEYLFLEEESGELDCPWAKLKRICFLNEGWKGVEEVNFDACEFVSVLKVNIQWFVESSKMNLDLKGLRSLRSFELKANKFLIECSGFESLKNLVILRWWADKATSPCIEAIGSLTKLQILEIKGFDGDTVPNLANLIALQVVCFAHCDNISTVQGFTSDLSQLRSLCISRCSNLLQCPGLGELHALEDLDLWGCNKLEAIPSLQRIPNLTRLNVSECVMLRDVPGLRSASNLQELRAKGCSRLRRLPHLTPTKLEVLRCTDLSEVDFIDLGVFPRLKEWTFGWSRALKSVSCSSLIELAVIDLTLCLSLEEVPDLSHFPGLEKLILQGCASLVRLTCSAPLPALTILNLEGCKRLTQLPKELGSLCTGLEVVRLQKSGILMSAEEEMKLKASCASFFPSSDPSKYGDEYVVPTGIIPGFGMETNDQNQYRSRRLWDPLPREKITKLIYSNNGSRLQTEGEMNLLALTSGGMHKRWDWKNQATVNVAPKLWQPIGGVLMVNDINTTTPEEEVRPCSMALCNDNDHLLSASGGPVSFYTMTTDKVDQETVLQELQSTATFLAFYPHDDDVLAIGLEDSTIAIINEWEKQVVCTLKGHQNRITCLAFSKFLRVLVSLGADNQLFAWKTDQWVRRQLDVVQYQPDGGVPCKNGVRVQFHHDQVRLLAISKSQLVVYRILERQDDALELDRLNQWDLQSPFTSTEISDATYSCDSQLIYVAFANGTVGILDAESFWLRCLLVPPVHPPLGMTGCRATTNYATAIAANPRRRNQFALGMSDGDVLVVETGADTGRLSGEEIDESAEGESERGDQHGIEEPGASYGCFDYIHLCLRSFLMRYCRSGNNGLSFLSPHQVTQALTWSK